MEWKTLEGITDQIEINAKGQVRYTDDKSPITPNFSRVTGYYEVNLIFNTETRKIKTTKRNLHILVAIYFLNGGALIDKRKRVVFKDEDTSNFVAKNLDIVERYSDGSVQKSKEVSKSYQKESIYLNYGDEIYC